MFRDLLNVCLRHTVDRPSGGQDPMVSSRRLVWSHPGIWECTPGHVAPGRIAGLRCFQCHPIPCSQKYKQRQKQKLPSIIITPTLTQKYEWNLSRSPLSSSLHNWISPLPLLHVKYPTVVYSSDPCRWKWMAETCHQSRKGLHWYPDRREERTGKERESLGGIRIYKFPPMRSRDDFEEGLCQHSFNAISRTTHLTSRWGKAIKKAAHLKQNPQTHAIKQSKSGQTTNQWVSISRHYGTS